LQAKQFERINFTFFSPFLEKKLMLNQCMIQGIVNLGVVKLDERRNLSKGIGKNLLDT